MPPQTGNQSYHVTGSTRSSMPMNDFGILNVSSSQPVIVLTGGLGNAATVCFKRLSSMHTSKCDQPYTTARLRPFASSDLPSDVLGVLAP